MQEDLLFLPFVLKNFRLKNRIGVAPMTRMSSPGDSIPRQDVLDFLVQRAKNGAAIVYTEAIVTDYESAQCYPGQARLVTQRQIDAWGPVVRAIQAVTPLIFNLMNQIATIWSSFHSGLPFKSFQSDFL